MLLALLSDRRDNLRQQDGRLIPENVLVDHSGSVRLIGFAVDAAMHGLPPGRPSGDVADLGGILYCALTGKWPGRSDSALAPAPVVVTLVRADDPAFRHAASAGPRLANRADVFLSLLDMGLRAQALQYARALRA